MLGKALAFFLAPSVIVYGAYVLWPTSHCQRVEHAAVPAYWAGHLVRLAAEPLVSPQTLPQVAQYPQRARELLASGITIMFYRRNSYAELCALDPVHLYRSAQLLDERGLLNQPQLPKPATLQEVLQSAQQSVLAQQQVSSQAGKVSSWSWGWLLLLLTPLLLVLEAPRRVLLVRLRKIGAAHKSLLEHFLPREAIKPSAGKDRTDLT